MLVGLPAWWDAWRWLARPSRSRDDAEPESAAAALEKDYLVTVDILDSDYAPVGTWGKRSNLWG